MKIQGTGKKELVYKHPGSMMHNRPNAVLTCASPDLSNLQEICRIIPYLHPRGMSASNICFQADTYFNITSAAVYK